MELSYNIPNYSGIEEVVTLAEAKAHLRVEHTDEDTVIQGFIDGAIAQVEGYLGGPILLRSGVTFTQSGWSTRVEFPTGPVSVTSVQYYVDDAYSTLSSSLYKLYNFGTTRQAVIFKEAAISLTIDDDTADAIKITADVGRLTADVPQAIKSAVLLLINDFYEFRGEKDMRLNASSRSLLRPFRYF